MSDHTARTHDSANSGRRARWLRSAGAGLVAAVVPVLAQAADVQEQGRALEGSDDFGTVALITLLAAGGVLLLATLGRLYQRQRGIRWRFQDPDSPHDGGH